MGEEDLLPQGDTVPKDAQEHKDELKRIEKYVIDLQQRVMTQCEKFSDDVKYWAEYRTGIKEFKPWLEASEKKAQEGLSKPSTLDEANALFATVTTFDQGCLKYFRILENAEQASLKMTTHKEADDEVKELKDRYSKVKLISDEWMKKAETLIKEWKLLWENSRIFSKKKKGLWTICKKSNSHQFTTTYHAMIHLNVHLAFFQS